jgi:hypothetical protein
MRIFAALLILLAGCDVVLGLKENKPDVVPDAMLRCGAAVFASTFDDNVDFARRWNRELDPGTSIEIVEQSLAATNGVPRGYATARTNATYDFRDGIAQVQIVETFASAGIEQYMNLSSAGNPETAHYMNLDIDTSNGRVYLDTAFKLDGVVMSSMGVEYDPIAHRFWRIEHVSETNSIVYSTSVDGGEWTERRRMAAMFPVDSVTIMLGVGSYNPTNTKSLRGRFDDFELCRK